MPDLDFDVVGAEVLSYAASPTLLFKVRIRNSDPEQRIQAIMLRVQIRIEATQRRYGEESEELLLELFGEPARWSDTVRTLLWTHAAVTVPPFAGSIDADVPIACTYDFDVVSSKYLNALGDGDIPQLFLFSGTMLYNNADGALQIDQISWEKEAKFRLPARLWREMMDHYFPNSAWLRVRKDVFDRLVRFKGRRALPTWEAALEELLCREEERTP